MQELISDWYVRMEAFNLEWLRRNQKLIRAELYGGLTDALQAGDTDASQLGKRTVLPTTFTGSPRNVAQNYQVEDIMFTVSTYKTTFGLGNCHARQRMLFCYAYIMLTALGQNCFNLRVQTTF